MEQEKSVESMEGMIRCSANHVPLSPISFLERSASVYRDRVAIVYGRVKFTWRDTLERCTRLASAITHLGISRGDVVQALLLNIDVVIGKLHNSFVAALAPNIPAMYELHFGVPMAGAVLCTLNIRHDSAMVSTLLKHSEAKMIFVDYQLLDTAQEALKILSKARTKLPRLVLIPECDKLQPTISNSGPLLLET
ncbi:putative acyl-activating enzyme 1, peroxisomal [Vitis vinifera]|uniref:Putative acyl-activating enzyme 1, peroxisomal n=1 Tax=Vitis vinifera TaxID=29760 RepID=A0A438ETL8_VITVI|nr:putative acyl-activating enzyme 1, peroxisomal [Vitis vinifera]